jgi:hypothetical protein
MISRPAATPSRAGSRQPLVVELSALGGRPSPLMGGKVSGLNLHSRLTGEVRSTGTSTVMPENTARRPPHLTRFSTVSGITGHADSRDERRLLDRKIPWASG